MSMEHEPTTASPDPTIAAEGGLGDALSSLAAVAGQAPEETLPVLHEVHRRLQAALSAPAPVLNEPA